jgi:tRNA U34 5-carboxymethylaminomethyl modifying enzyme MnmG/GidA
VYVIFQKRLDHEKEALANISTTKPQEIVRGLRMEAVKETKITLILHYSKQCHVFFVFALCLP